MKINLSKEAMDTLMTLVRKYNKRPGDVLNFICENLDIKQAMEVFDDEEK